MTASDAPTAAKQFPFFKLPPELRFSIYGYAIGAKVFVGDYCSQVARRKDTAFALLFANKQMHEEVAGYLYASSTFIFREAQSLRTFLDMINADDRNQIRHVRLELTPLDFLELFMHAQTEDEDSMADVTLTVDEVPLVLESLTLASLQLCLRPFSDLDSHSNGPLGYYEGDAQGDYDDAMKWIPEVVEFLAHHIPTVKTFEALAEPVLSAEGKGVWIIAGSENWEPESWTKLTFER